MLERFRRRSPEEIEQLVRHGSTPALFAAARQELRPKRGMEAVDGAEAILGHIRARQKPRSQHPEGNWHRRPPGWRGHSADQVSLAGRQ